MKIQLERKNDTTAVVDITAEVAELNKIKEKTLKLLAPSVKVAGFREGKVPIAVVEKNVSQQTLQTEFLNEAVNALYIAVLKEERIRPVAKPKVDIKKFVPFNVLEITLEIEVVGEIKMPNYKVIMAKPAEVKIETEEISKVLKNLRLRLADKKEVSRVAKNSDEAMIDFKGVDEKGAAVAGADGIDYPLALGSGTFIPGFEENIVGMKPGEDKKFAITFPKDYGAKELQNAKVTFTVTLKKLNEVIEPKMDDEFAKKVGPFISMTELKSDIKRQLKEEKEIKVERDYESAIVDELADKTKVAIPEILISEQQESVLQEVRQNTVQRGTTFQDFLKLQDISEEDYINQQVRPEAIRRIKAGLLLGEIADLEGIDVSDQELEIRINQMKSQYKDKQMHEQIDSPDAQRETRARLRSEKVVQFLKKTK